MKKIVIAIAAAMLIIYPGGASGEEINKDFHKSFSVNRESCLRLHHGDGDVTINAWDKDILDIEVHYYAEHKHLGSGDKRDFDVEFKEKNGIVEVTGRESSPSFLGFQVFIIRDYTYTIHAPSYLRLDLEGEDGTVDIEGWKGNIECQVDDGDIGIFNTESPRTRLKFEDGEIDIEGHKGNIDLVGDDGRVRVTDSRIPEGHIQVVDGEIKIKDCDGNFELESDDGDIELYRLKSKWLDIESSDGDVELDLLKTNELDLNIRTDDGDVIVDIEKEISASFTIDVDDASIRIDLPSATNVHRGDNWMSGTIYGGKGKIRIRTREGNVTMKERR